MRTSIVAGSSVAVIAAVGAFIIYENWGVVMPLGATAINVVRTLSPPRGTLVTQVAAPDPRIASTAPHPVVTTHEADWPSYNRTLLSDRFSNLDQINRGNVAKLRVLCTYDTHQRTSFEAGPIVVDGSMIITTEHDTISIDPATCKEKWRTAEAYTPASPLSVNRGAAYMDGMLFRGTEDGRVLAYDFKTGRRLWQATIADPAKGETTPAAPIAWNGMVFIGNAGGDQKDSRGRVYGLDAKTGKIVWEFYLVPKAPGDKIRGPQGATPLTDATWKNSPEIPISGGGNWTSYTLDPAKGLLYVPGGNPAPDFDDQVRGGSNLYTGSIVVLDAKTGAYQKHFKLPVVERHDWDVSTAPSLITTWSGKRLLAVAPKDGMLYGVDLATDKILYQTPVNRRENVDAEFSSKKLIHFCPGASGGAEWNGAAYDPQSNLILIGEVDWCTSVKLESNAKLRSVATGAAWTGMQALNPYNGYGVMDPVHEWAGWVYAVDADSGRWNWRVRSNYPVMSGMTPTAGGVTFFGDMGGHFYALDSSNGKKLWGQQLDGAVGGGVITYTVTGTQKVAVAIGFTSFMWPTKVTTAKLVILGL